MSTAPPAPLSLASTYVHLRDDRSASPIEVTPTFWQEVMSAQRPEIEVGRMVTQIGFSTDWTSWEMHPAGEEVVALISGAVELLLEGPGGVESVTLKAPGDYALVPRGVWHTARTKVPCQMIIITPGEGTQHRPVSA